MIGELSLIQQVLIEQVLSQERSFGSGPLGHFGCPPFHRRLTLVQLDFDLLL